MRSGGWILIAALAVAPGMAHAQETARLDVDAGRLRPGVSTYRTFRIQGQDTVPTGTTRDEIEFAMEEGRAVVRRSYTSVHEGGNTGSVMSDAAPALAPLRYRSRGFRGAEGVDYRDGRALGFRIAAKDSIATSDPVPAGVYQASTFDLVLRASDLHEAWRAEIRVYVLTQRRIARIPAAVRGVETIDGRACWRVVTDYDGTPIVFWIDRETRDLCQMRITFAATRHELHRRASPARDEPGLHLRTR